MRLLGLFRLTAMLVSFCGPAVGELTTIFVPPKGGAAVMEVDGVSIVNGTAEWTPEAKSRALLDCAERSGGTGARARKRIVSNTPMSQMRVNRKMYGLNDIK